MAPLSARWPRILVIAGIVAMGVGLIDPLEGSVVILGGTGLAALGAFLGKSRHLKLSIWAFILAAVGIGALFAISSVGGFGRGSGRSNWWALILVPYPVGLIMSVVGAILFLKESASRAALGRNQSGPESPNPRS